MSFFNANWPQWQLDQLCARKTTPVDLRSYSFAREELLYSVGDIILPL